MMMFGFSFLFHPDSTAVCFLFIIRFLLLSFSLFLLRFYVIQVMFGAYALCFEVGLLFSQNNILSFGNVLKVFMLFVFSFLGLGRITSFLPDYQQSRLAADSLFDMIDARMSEHIFVFVSFLITLSFPSVFFDCIVISFRFFDHIVVFVPFCLFPQCGLICCFSFFSLSFCIEVYVLFCMFLFLARSFLKLNRFDY